MNNLIIQASALAGFLFLGTQAALALSGCGDKENPSPSPSGSGGAGGGAGGHQGGGGEGGSGGEGGEGGSGGEGGAPGPCLADTDCDDAIKCTKDRCIQGACLHEILTLTGCEPEEYCDPGQGGCVKSPPCKENKDCQGVFIDHPCIALKYCKPATLTCDFSLLDADADGHVPFTCGGDDCDDDVVSAHPGLIESCDGIDNDCSGVIDDLPGVDLTAPQTCGTCSHNCFTDPSVANCDPASVTCSPSPMPGPTPGACGCGQCAEDYYDLDANGSCEYYCIKSNASDAICDNKDNDCDGLSDEDVDLCTSAADCGQCGRACVALHGVAGCKASGAPPCGVGNTQCIIESCDCAGPGSCWWDADGSYLTGCEYQCDLTNGGVEICDGLDNDCNGAIDGVAGCP